VDTVGVTVRARGLAPHVTLCGVLRYGLSVRQRLVYLVLGIGLLLAAWSLARVDVAVPGGLLVLWFFASAHVGSAIDGSGVQLRGIYRRHLSWTRVSDVSTARILGCTIVVLRLGSGGRRWLRAPYTGPLQRDRDFDAKVETIRHCWQHSTGQLAS
jgi:hypothetical protein